MKKLAFILFLASLCTAVLTAQNAEVARIEIPLTAKTQQCGYVTMGQQGILAFAESATVTTKGLKDWDFFVIDTNLVEQNQFKASFDASLQIQSSTASEEFAAIVFASTKRSDSTLVNIIFYDRGNNKFRTFATKLPPNITLLHAVAVEHTLMTAYNFNNGGAIISFYNTQNGKARHKNLQDENFLIQNIESLPTTKNFVVTLKEFENKHSIATNFQIFTTDGITTNSFSYPNSENATIGRSCSRIDENGSLEVLATIERISSTKVSAKDFANNYDKVSVGVGWFNFSTDKTQSKIYLFKNIPDIDKALTPNNRLRVKQRQAQQKNDSTVVMGEIGFQLLKPDLLSHNDTNIIALEAFVPIYHTETRMEFGYYGSIPTTYTVFDGYDFYAQLLFAFNKDGNLLWHNHTKFDNPIDETLTRHTNEAICHNEILTLSTAYNSLIYSVTDINGEKLLDDEEAALPMMNKNDILVTESSSYIRHWYDNNFIIAGKQTVKNRMMRKAERSVFFIQKTLYE